MPRTPITPLRLTPEDLAELDLLVDFLDAPSRTEAVREAIRRVVHAEGIGTDFENPTPETPLAIRLVRAALGSFVAKKPEAAIRALLALSRNDMEGALDAFGSSPGAVDKAAAKSPPPGAKLADVISLAEAKKKRAKRASRPTPKPTK